MNNYADVPEEEPTHVIVRNESLSNEVRIERCSGSAPLSASVGRPVFSFFPLFSFFLIFLVPCFSWRNVLAPRLCRPAWAAGVCVYLWFVCLKLATLEHPPCLFLGAQGHCGNE